jgi:hypothetical protein
VGGVAGDEDAADPPAAREQGVVGVLGDAGDGEAVGVDVAGEPGVEGGRVGRGLAVGELELPAAVVGDAVGVDGEAFALEVVAEAGRQAGGVGGVAQEGVDDEPLAARGEGLHLDAEGGAHRAAAAVAADDEGGAQGAGGAVGVLDGDEGVVVVVGDGDGVDAEGEGDAGVAGEAVAQDAFEGGLVEEAGAEVAVGGVGVGDVFAEEDGAVAVEDLYLTEGTGMSEQARHEAGGLEVAQGLLVDVGGAGDRVDGGFALEHGDGAAEGAEEVGEHGPGGATTDDHDVQRGSVHAGSVGRAAAVGVADVGQRVAGSGAGAGAGEIRG